jgi:hypothetical protein
MQHPWKVLSSLSLWSMIDLPVVEDVSVLPPPYIVRVLMIYGRSHCPIEFTKKEVFQHLRAKSIFCV